MTRRERLIRCYFHQEQDRPAVYSRSGFPPDDPSYEALKAYFAGHTELKVDWNTLACETPLPMRRRREPHSEDWEREIITLETPAGPLESSHLHSLKGEPGRHETYFLKSREDAEKYLSLPLPELHDDISAQARLEREMGDAGIVQAYLSPNPGGSAVELFGSELFAIMSVTDRDVIHALCQRRLTMLLNRVKFLLSHGVGPFFCFTGEEYIVPPLHGPRDFWDFVVRYDKPVIDLIHEGGGRVHIHCHGSIKHVIKGLVEMGADVLHPFEPAPQGNITAAEAKAAARGRMSLEGNIQIDRMYRCSPEEIREETLALIRDAFDDRRGLIVCPTASPYIRDKGEACFPAYKAMIDTVLAWQG
jgi:hypothetical protein